MPKSSSQTFTPVARSCASSALACASSPITAVSVSSRCRLLRPPGRCRAGASRPRRGRSPLRSWRGETLTDTNSGSAVAMRRCQRTASSQAARSTCGPMRFDQAALLGDVDEHRRRDHAHARGCCQRSSASAPTQAAVGEAVDRLVDEAQFAALPGAAQVLLQVHAALDRLVHRAAVEAVAVLAGDLGLVHRDVAVLHQHGRAGGVLREQRDADRGAEEHLAVRAPRSAGRVPPPASRPGGWRSRARRRRRRRPAPGSTNSSPPKRASIASSPPMRSHRLRGCACANCSSTSSPASWPSVSLTRLKSSMSANSSASWRPAPLQLQQALVERLAERQAVGQAGQRVGVGHAADVAVVPRDAARSCGRRRAPGRRPRRCASLTGASVS